jgi:predicted esterase
VATVGLGGVAYVEDWVPGTERIKRRFADTGPDGTIPDVPQGDVRLERRTSEARGREVGLFTAVPEGHGDGEGLPVCLVLHGASATTADYEAFGFGRFLTAAVRAGVPPFVLVGVDGGRIQWRASGDDDPQRMLIDEVPAWLADRGFAWDRRAAWGWSMGGMGALLLAEALADTDPLAAVAAFSPALPDDREDAVWTDADRLAATPVGLWCGTADPLIDKVQRLATELDPAPAIAAWAKGAHERGYWDRVTPDAFGFIGEALTP